MTEHFTQLKNVIDTMLIITPVILSIQILKG